MGRPWAEATLLRVAIALEQDGKAFIAPTPRLYINPLEAAADIAALRREATA
jgi:hypothetical protein